MNIPPVPGLPFDTSAYPMPAVHGGTDTPTGTGITNINSAFAAFSFPAEAGGGGRELMPTTTREEEFVRPRGSVAPIGGMGGRDRGARSRVVAQEDYPGDSFDDYQATKRWDFDGLRDGDADVNACPYQRMHLILQYDTDIDSIAG